MVTSSEDHGGRIQEREDERLFTHRDFERFVAIIRSDDEITTVRDATVAFRGIREQLALMTKVFAGTVAVGIACFSYFFVVTTDLSKTVTRIDERLTGNDRRFDDIDRRLDALTAAVGRLQPPQKQTSLE